ncbi:MAG: hypothetical protein M1818_001561 [Claussenomyces sp. TS43310]|nr:MAG: hypothetical protein M1818_001561 [Claussenomyces sp. TS43310]
MPLTAPYGTWSTPISSAIIAGKSVTFSEVHVDTTSRKIYTIESRPTQDGRCCITEQRPSTSTSTSTSTSIDLLPQPYSARSQVHEYGGGAACIAPHDGSLIFSDWATKGIYRLSAGITRTSATEEAAQVSLLLPGHGAIYYGDFDAYPVEARWILAVREDHRGDATPDAVENSLVAIETVPSPQQQEEQQRIVTVARGADFYSTPRFSGDGRAVCWLQWNHPDMPWTGTQLYVAPWEPGCDELAATLVAGRPGLESICQPKWDETDGSLYFASDRTGFWQLYSWRADTAEVRPLLLEGFERADLAAKEEELGKSTYIILNKDELVVTYTKYAKDGLLLVQKATRECTHIASELIQISPTTVRRVSDTQFVVVGATATAVAALYLIDVSRPAEKVLLKSSLDIDLAPSIFSVAEQISFPRTHGQDLRGSGHAIFNPPHNPEYEAPANTKPPLIVWCHGGPTGHDSLGLDLAKQYWTSRGFARVAVNYAGSTGYGRAYRELLDGHWGDADVADAASCAAFLARTGRVDASRIGIVGRSSGGYTVLRALHLYADIWAGGVSHFGIGNVSSLVATTHKFESHYADGLLFGSREAGAQDLTPQEEERVYRERSPCFHAADIKAPLLLLQGAEDKVVPLEQAQEMADIMRARGADSKLVVFEGEGHGFRLEANVKRALEEEQAMWIRTLVR